MSKKDFLFCAIAGSALGTILGVIVLKMLAIML